MRTSLTVSSPASGFASNTRPMPTLPRRTGSVLGGIIEIVRPSSARHEVDATAFAGHSLRSPRRCWTHVDWTHNCITRNAQNGCIRVVHHYASSRSRPVAHCSRHRHDAHPHGFGKIGRSCDYRRQIGVVGATGGGMTGGCFAKCLCLCDLRVFPSGFVNRRSRVRIPPVAVTHP